MRRSDSLEKLPDRCDVLVIGGGATGLGVAVDSASRGYSTVLVDALDFAHGTSSRSTNLIHGGVRYLQQGNVGLVREALRERGLLVKNAPHLVHQIGLVSPSYAWWERPFYGAGLRLYDLMAGSRGFSPRRILSAEATRRLAPTVRTAHLRGGVSYSDGQFNDARLAFSLVKTASRLGAVLVNYAPVTAFVKERGKLCGAVLSDCEGGKEHTVRAQAVINATGVFADAVRRMDEPNTPDVLAVSQGVHLVLPQHFLPSSTGIVVLRTRDGRICFMLPWEGRTLVGTTDTPVSGPSVDPRPTQEEIGFLIECAATYLDGEPSLPDVVSVFTGLRPLVKGGTAKTSALSRDHTIFVSESGLITIVGGKWTTYRHMAEMTVNRAIAVSGLPKRACVTADLRLSGAECASSRWAEFGVEDPVAVRYESRYPGKLHPALPYTMGMVGYVVEEEMPVTLEDVLSRRLRALRLDAKAALEAAPAVADLMASMQARNRAWVEKELAEFARAAANALIDQ
jgi:glycerol-3-phosphate dehydrogenase